MGDLSKDLLLDMYYECTDRRFEGAAKSFMRSARSVVCICTFTTDRKV